MNDIEQIVGDAIAQFTGTGDAAELERVKAGYLGRAGRLTEMLKGLGKLPPEARREAGALINAAQARLEAPLRGWREVMLLTALEAQLSAVPPAFTRSSSAASPLAANWAIASLMICSRSFIRVLSSLRDKE